MPAGGGQVPGPMSQGLAKYRYRRNDLLAGTLFLLPMATGLAGLILTPVAGTVADSFFRDTLFQKKTLVGLANYAALLHEPAFWQSLRFTLAFVLVSVPLEMAAGLVFALLMNVNAPWRSWLRTAILIPWIMPVAISARIWELILNFRYGPANFLLEAMGLHPVNWLGTPAGAFASLVAGDLWKTAPFVAVLLLTGLVTIPRDLYEQAQADGANWRQRFWHVTLPMLKPVLLVALLFRTIDGLRIFDLIYVLTQGGPGGATTSLSIYGYNFFLAGNFGFGSAVSVVLFLAALGLALVYLKAGRFREELG